MNYNFDDIINAFENLSVKKGDVIYVTGDLSYFGRYEKIKKIEVLNDWLLALKDIVGAKGTIVCPTFTFSYCNTDKIYDTNNATSETGVLTEFIRKQKGSKRNLHPYSSFCALGRDAEYICADSTRFAHGLFSPFDKMIDLDAKFISLGMPPEKTCSLVHHVEQMLNVPYRFTKQFIQKVKTDSEINEMAFYLFVTHSHLEIKRNKNVKIMKYFRKESTIEKTALGSGAIYQYSMAKFNKLITKLMSKDLFVWLDSLPAPLIDD